MSAVCADKTCGFFYFAFFSLKYVFSILTCAGECSVIIVPVYLCVCGRQCEHFRWVVRWKKTRCMCTLLMLVFNNGVILWFYNALMLHVSRTNVRHLRCAVCSKTMIYLFREFSRSTWTSSGETVPKNICRSVRCSLCALCSHFGNEILRINSTRGARTYTHARARGCGVNSIYCGYYNNDFATRRLYSPVGDFYLRQR